MNHPIMLAYLRDQRRLSFRQKEIGRRIVVALGLLWLAAHW